MILCEKGCPWGGTGLRGGWWFSVIKWREEVWGEGRGSSSQLQLLCSKQSRNQSDRGLQASRAHRRPMAERVKNAAPPYNRACPCSSQPPHPTPPHLTGINTITEVMPEPHANIQTVQQPWACGQRSFAWCLKRTAGWCKDDACNLLFSSHSGSGVTCPDTEWIQIIISQVTHTQKTGKYNLAASMFRKQIKKGDSVQPVHAQCGRTTAYRRGVEQNRRRRGR